MASELTMSRRLGRWRLSGAPGLAVYDPNDTPLNLLCKLDPDERLACILRHITSDLLICQRLSERVVASAML